MRSSEAMELLGFAPYSRPSPSEVKAAYRRMVMESHPDRVPMHQKPQAESKFKQIVEAYSCLKDGRRFGNRMEVHVMRSGVPTGYGRSNKTLVPTALRGHTSGKRKFVPLRTLFFHSENPLYCRYPYKLIEEKICLLQFEMQNNLCTE